MGIVGGSANTVQNVKVAANEGATTDFFGEGVTLQNSTGNFIQDNTLLANGPYAGVTLLGDSDDNILRRNKVLVSAVTHQDIGIRLEAEAGTIGVNSGAEPDKCPDGNTVEDNSVSGSAIDGLSVLNGNTCDSTGNIIRRSAFIGNGRDGVRLNARCFNDPLGTAAAPCPTPGSPAANTVPHGALNNTVTDNDVCDNGGAGIRATAATSGNTISSNRAGAGTVQHGPTAGTPCLPNNPIITGTPSTSPLLPPHGDLNDGNGNCTYNTWNNNAYNTKTPACIS